jgi:alkaline phosphatase D
MKLSRRDLLKISGGAAVALAACGNEAVAPVDAETLPTDASLAPEAERRRFKNGMSVAKLSESSEFPLGVAAGDVTSDSVVLWTRYHGDETVSVHVWEDDAGAAIIWQNRAVQFVEGFAHEAPTIVAGKRYVYAFVAGSVRSPLGYFRAAIAPGSLEPVTFMGFACTHYRREPFPALEQAAKRDDLDFWVAGGDKVYCDGLQGLQPNYRAAYERVYSQSGMYAMHQRASHYGTWDDHEFENNFNPEKTDPAVTALAKQTYFEHHPFKRPDNDQIWRSVRWGNTLELFILDCRSERLPSQDQYISRAQMDWLKDGLKNTPCVFKMIVNSVPISDFPLVFDFKARDRWAGYKEQRNEILSHINDNGISDVWWLAGDFHFGSIGRVSKDGPSSAQREILWGPGGNRPDPLYYMLDDPQWDFATGDSNCMVLSCDPIAKTVRVTVVNDRGTTLFDQVY